MLSYSQSLKLKIHPGSPSLAFRAVRVRPSTLRARRSSVPQARGANEDVSDRVIAALPYLVPLLDGLRYGRFFFMQNPSIAQVVLLPLEPLIRIYTTVPYASLIAFFGIYLGIINNYKFTRFVRFNAMQAIVLNILLIVPSILESVFRPPAGGIGLQLYINLYTAIFLFIFVCVSYAIVSCLAGKQVSLPIVGEAADRQIR